MKQVCDVCGLFAIAKLTKNTYECKLCKEIMQLQNLPPASPSQKGVPFVDTCVYISLPLSLSFYIYMYI